MPNDLPLSRRQFVASSIAMAGLPVLVGARQPGQGQNPAAAPPTAPNSWSMSKTPVVGPLRVGVIGCGGRGTGAAVQVLKADPKTTIVAMGDVFGDRLESSLKNLKSAMGDDAAARIDVPQERQFLGFDCHEKVINAGVDVVLLTSYPHFRPMHLKAAIDAGKHVFAEKPLAVDAPGVRSVLESAEKARAARLGLLVGFCWRYHDALRAGFAAVNNGAIGDVYAAHTTYHTSTLPKRPRQAGWSDVEFQMRNWWHFNWVSGDHIVEQAVHSIDRLSWAMNDRIPQRVTCLGGRAARFGPEHGDVFDHFAAIYEYADGRRGFHTTRQIDGCPSDNTDYLFGTNGKGIINGWKPQVELRDDGGNEAFVYKGPPPRDMYQAEHDEFFKSLRDGDPINEGERGAHVTLMAIMARMAAYTGQTITWEQAMNSTQRLGPEKYELGALEVGSVPIPGKTKFV